MNYIVSFFRHFHILVGTFDKQQLTVQYIEQRSARVSILTTLLCTSFSKSIANETPRVDRCQTSPTFSLLMFHARVLALLCRDIFSQSKSTDPRTFVPCLFYSKSQTKRPGLMDPIPFFSFQYRNSICLYPYLDILARRTVSMLQSIDPRPIVRSCSRS